MRKSLALVAIAILVITTTGFQAVAQDMVMDMDMGGKGTAEAMIGDLVFMRPLGITATAVGAVLFVVSVPFSLTGMNTGESFERLVADPVEYTFSRPLGDVEY
jgi:hypothetical protein